MLYDSWGYRRIAENLQQFGIFSQGDENNLIPDSVRTPVYPLFLFFLRTIGIGFYGIIMLQILLSAATCALTAYLAGDILNNKKALIFSGLLMSFDFPSIFFSTTLLTETLFTFLLLLTFILFVLFIKKRKKIHLLVAAFFMGGTILCRPVAVFLPLIFGIALFFMPPMPNFNREDITKPSKKTGFISGTAKSAALFFILMCYLVISPWIIRNTITFGSPFLSTVTEINLLFHTASGIRALDEGKTVFQIQNEYKKLSGQNYDWKKESEAVRFARFSREEALAVIQENPLIFIKNYVGSCVHFFIKPLRNYIDLQLGFESKYESISGLSENRFTSIISRTLQNTGITALFIVIFQLVFMLSLYCFFILYFWKKKTKLNRVAGLALVIILYFGLVSGLTEVDARMRVPVMPLICLIAGAGVSLLLKPDQF